MTNSRLRHRQAGQVSERSREHPLLEIRLVAQGTVRRIDSLLLGGPCCSKARRTCVCRFGMKQTFRERTIQCAWSGLVRRVGGLVVFRRTCKAELLERRWCQSRGFRMSARHAVRHGDRCLSLWFLSLERSSASLVRSVDLRDLYRCGEIQNFGAPFVMVSSVCATSVDAPGDPPLSWAPFVMPVA